jgi:hypothetical protein
LAATADVTNLQCGQTSGTITINATGGTAPYTYSLNGATAVSASFTGLSAGVYKVTVKDGGGCSVDVNAIISLLNSTLLATAAVTNAGCGETTGSSVINATGGTGPYTYSLNGGDLGNASAFPGLPLGAHKVTVKDAQGCTYDVGFIISG